MCINNELIITYSNMKDSIHDRVNDWNFTEETKDKIMEALDNGIQKASKLVIELEPFDMVKE